MDFIPLVCGTYPRSTVQAIGARCPVCRATNAVDVVTHYQRCCLCFIPLCKVGGQSTRAQCERCGASMPVSVTLSVVAGAAVGGGGGSSGGGGGGGGGGRGGVPSAGQPSAQGGKG
jgi:hypothetical protein